MRGKDRRPSFYERVSHIHMDYSRVEFKIISISDFFFFFFFLRIMLGTHKLTQLRKKKDINQ